MSYLLCPVAPPHPLLGQRLPTFTPTERSSEVKPVKSFSVSFLYFIVVELQPCPLTLIG